MVLPSLRYGGYHYTKLVNIGVRVGGNRAHIIDAIAWQNAGSLFLISSKWQQTAGTAEQKVPFEVICLGSAVVNGTTIPAATRCLDCTKGSPERFAAVAAYLILGGDGWTLRNFYVAGGLREFIPIATNVEVVTLETFVARANKGGL